ncbi:MAG TPA: hypothetical protein VK025_08810 [Steroidobacter sp.]|jgi:hypothetical protein|nr:hypothetical protein [Steroidobacteraceae bacterium]HLS81490.1 hypothetical protein [Steroidobacter sp.]
MNRTAPQATSAFKGRRVRFTHTQTFTASIDAVFPLLCPVREYDYLPAWECEVVYLASGYAETGGVFLTNNPQEGGRDVWVIARYAPNETIQFVRTNPLRTMIYNVEARSDEPGTVRLFWEQIITGLTEEGNGLVESLRETDFVEMMSAMQELLQHYLDTGKMMSHAPESR